LNINIAKNHFEFGLASFYEGKFLEAERELRLANELAPNRASILVNLSSILISQKKWYEALNFCEQLLKLEPDCSDGLLNKGVCLLNQDHHEQALSYFDRAIKIDPSLVSAWINKGNLLLEDELFDAARACFIRSLELNPNSEEALIGLGNIHIKVKEFLMGIEFFSKVIEINPQNAFARWNKSLALIHLGKFEEGWSLFESRWDTPDIGQYKKKFELPLWLGEHPLKNKTILICAEQGYGDTIQFSRYIPLIEALGAQVIFLAPSPLCSLMQTISNSVTVLNEKAYQPEKSLYALDFHCPIMSLAHAFKTTLDSIPNKTPYLYTNSKKYADWSEIINKSSPQKKLNAKQIRIGLSWAGSGHYAGRKNLRRDVPIKLIKNFLWEFINEENIEFYSLQVDKSNLTLLELGNLFAYETRIKDFSDTAALISNLDLVISVDTAVSHLSGSLGKLTFLLLPDPPDFLSPLFGNTTPWYPKTLIFRQSIRGSWAEPLREISNKVRELYLR
jgi:tetratricopeptide (TPR) repeat protein